LSAELSIPNSGLCVVSHDAGGAELLASWVARQEKPCSLLLAGPAVRVFERRLGRSPETIGLERALQVCDRFLTGSSWQSDLEWRVIGAARARGKPVATFLDHWVNYRERFVRNSVEHLPDELWVADAEAEKIATRLFIGVPVRYVENPYFSDLRTELAQLSQATKKNSHGLNVLYVCEPLREHALREYGDERHWGYTEEDALRYFLLNIETLGTSVERIVIRPHPSEFIEKYDWALKEFDLPVQHGGRKTLFEEVAECDVVVGCESMAMVVGLLAGRRVISCVPPGGKPCSLPQPEIESMQEFLRNKTRCAL
jgi:hypothetical protein